MITTINRVFIGARGMYKLPLSVFRIMKRFIVALFIYATPFLIVAPFLAATLCFAGGGHPHGSGGHDDHGDDHGHSDEPALVYTHYNDFTELFVEFPPLVVGEPSTFVAHFTRMDNFKPLTTGTLDVHLKKNKKTVARFRVKAPARTGIFLPDVTARKEGEYQLVLEVRDGSLHSIHDLGNVRVFENKDVATVDQEEAEGEIGYLKEQQWVNPFAIARAKQQPLRASVPGFATVSAPADGFAVVRAPSDGYFSAEALLNTGESVNQSQLLGSLIPRLGDGADIGNLLVGQEKARAKFQLAEADVKRLKDLFEQGAIPEKRLLEAKQNLEIARVELNTSRSRLQQRSGKSGKAGIALTSPVAGELVDINVRPGSFVRAGDPLFTVADPTRRWMDIQVSEKFGENITQMSGAWLNHDGKSIVIDTSTGANVVRVSRQVDVKTRTVNAAIQYPSDIGPNLLGARVAVNVYVESPKPLLSVPVSAVIDDGGRPVVYVQTGGETFTRRTVLLGIQDGAFVEILQGVNEGDWVVTDGAYYVKLASTGEDAIGHGHAH